MVLRRGQWLKNYAWKIRLEAVEALASTVESCFLCGGFENEAEVWRLFDRVMYLVVDEETLRYRLANRTTNDFGKHPEELQAALDWRLTAEDRFRNLGAAIIDATQPVDLVAAQVLAAVEG